MAKSATRARTQHASRNERATGGGGEAAPAEQNRASGAHFTHFDASGQAHMVDVAAKAATHRVARARGRISMSDEAFAMVREGTAKKGDVLGVARIAAIQATKRTSDLVPLCHPIALTRVGVSFDLDAVQRAIEIEVIAETVGPTGVEMEALTGAAVGLLTIYDMCKAVDRAMRIEAVRLIEKEGGKSGHFVAA